MIFLGGFLDSGGGSYLDGVYYVGSELSSGFIVDIFALTLAADGKSVVSVTALDVITAAGGSGSLGGFGDFIVTTDGAAGTIYGASTIGFWSFDIATNAFTSISGTNPGQVATDQNGQLWRGLSTINPYDKATGTASSSPSYILLFLLQGCMI